MIMRVALISLYDINSFGIRTLHSVLRKNNIEVDSFFFKSENPNNTMDRPSEKELNYFINYLNKKEYDIIGISARSFIFPLAKEIALRFKSINQKTTLILGGIQATLEPEKCIEYFDIVCVGEGEECFLDICKGKPLSKINNIYYKTNKNTIKKNKVGYSIQNLDEIPFPDFQDKNKYFVNNCKISQLNTIEHRTKYQIMTSRGCPFGCKYCCNSVLRKIYRGKYLRRRSVDNVINELKEAKKIFPNLMRVSFFDDVFTFDKIWLKDFTLKYKREINLPFFCFTNPNMLDEETIRMLKYAGWVSTVMGVQTFSDKTRKLYGRPEKTIQILKAAELLNKYKIRLTFDMILDNPLETEIELNEGLECLLKMRPPFEVHTHTLTFFPHTQITEDFLKNKVIKKENIEDEAGKSWSRWAVFLDEKRDKLNLFYDCLYHLSQSKFRSEYLIRKLHKSNYFRKHPEKIAHLIKPFSAEYLGFDWNSRFDRLKFFISQGIIALFNGQFKFIFLKIRQQIKDPGMVVF